VHGPQDLGAGADVHTVANDRSAGHTGAPQAERDAVAQRHVVADDGVAADDDAAEVFDHQATADARFARQVDAGGDLHADLQELVDQRQRPAQHRGPYRVAPLPESVDA